MVSSLSCVARAVIDGLCISLDEVLRALYSRKAFGSGYVVVLLDACRQNLDGAEAQGEAKARAREVLSDPEK